MNHIPTSGHQCFQFFRNFLKWNQLFRKRIFQYFSPGQCKRIFCPVETVFFDQCYFTASRNHHWNKKKTVLKERAHSCQWKPDMLASRNHFFFIFQKLVPVIVSFPCSGSVFFNKILHSKQWQKIFWLVEIVYFCSEAFSFSGNRHLNQ